MSFAFLLPFIFAIILLVLVARCSVYRVRPQDIDHVILFVRKVDISDLEVLLDAGEEWALRQSLTPEAFRAVQQDRIRLFREYLRRVAHNVEMIQLWVTGEYDLIKDKDRASYTEEDLLIAEALQAAVELRMYGLATTLKVWFWTTFKVYLWPSGMVPRLPDLRVQCGIKVLARYQRLTEIAARLSLGYGKRYQERLLGAL